ncbi:Abortive infection bacteriophage resistance protein [hydrothermal vent metagenome]|uniref:Abortive infection bacteriophage resistance protein n=1 Tax=hydrothermal vent metagenome TaxID=652676 RepID=A0A3B0VU61_9ZZZZ
MQYTKPPLSISQQITKLQERNLIISDTEKAKNYLTHIGYYRLSAYFIPFEKTDHNGQRNHHFLPETQFQNIIDLYIFDRKLRLFIMEAIERIEVTIRTSWASALALENSNSHAYIEASFFNDPQKHKDMLSRASAGLNKSKEVYVSHYKNKYTQPDLPPIWAMVESLSFGSLSHWVKLTTSNKVKSSITKNLGLPTIKIMEKILHILTYVRNLCAHHSRVWNKRLTMQLPLIKHFKNDMVTKTISSKHNGQESTREIYNYLVVLAHLMQHIQPNTTWVKRLVAHIQTLDEKHHIKMGFPLAWQTKSLWQNNT